MTYTSHAREAGVTAPHTLVL